MAEAFWRQEAEEKGVAQADEGESSASPGQKRQEHRYGPGLTR